MSFGGGVFSFLDHNKFPILFTWDPLSYLLSCSSSPKTYLPVFPAHVFWGFHFSSNVIPIKTNTGEPRNTSVSNLSWNYFPFIYDIALVLHYSILITKVWCLHNISSEGYQESKSRLKMDLKTFVKILLGMNVLIICTLVVAI